MTRADRVVLAREVSTGIVERFGDAVIATGLQGSLARGDDSDLSDVDMLVVTTESDVIEPRALMVGAAVVDLRVWTRADLLAEAGTIDGSWPLRADRYVHAKALHDPGDLFKEVLRTYETAVSTAGDEPFHRAAGVNIVEAISLAYKARAVVAEDASARAFVSAAARSCVLATGCIARFAYKNLRQALTVGPCLVGIPEGFESKFLEAARAQTAIEAVTAMEEAVEILFLDGLAKGLPIAVEDVQGFLGS